MNEFANVDGAMFWLGPDPPQDAAGTSYVWIAAYRHVLSVCHSRRDVIGQTDPSKPEFGLYLSPVILANGIRMGRADFELSGPDIGNFSTTTAAWDTLEWDLWTITRARMRVERHDTGIVLQVGCNIKPRESNQRPRYPMLQEFHFRAHVPKADLLAIFRGWQPWDTPEKGLAYLYGEIDRPYV